MTRPKIVLWRPMYDQRGHQWFEVEGADIAVVDTPDAAAVQAELGDALGLWVRTPERVAGDLLDAAPSLVVISTSGVGTDNIDLDGATRHGILVVNHRGFGRIPVSEHTLMLLLAAMKKLTWSDRATRDGSAWDVRTDLDLHELEGQTLGVVGLGYIGSELARKLRLAFHCRVLAYDPHVHPRLPGLADVEMMQSLDGMLPQCRALCLCAELTDETRDMISDDALAKLPRGAIVVNAARGRILDLDALARALDSGHVAAAGLDVVFPEPLSGEHPLLRHPNVIFTPHTAGLTAETAERVTRSAVDQIMAALRGQLPRFPVNPAAWDGDASRRPG